MYSASNRFRGNVTYLADTVLCLWQILGNRENPAAKCLVLLSRVEAGYPLSNFTHPELTFDPSTVLKIDTTTYQVTFTSHLHTYINLLWFIRDTL